MSQKILENFTRSAQVAVEKMMFVYHTMHLDRTSAQSATIDYAERGISNTIVSYMQYSHSSKNSKVITRTPRRKDSS